MTDTRLPELLHGQVPVWDSIAASFVGRGSSVGAARQPRPAGAAGTAVLSTFQAGHGFVQQSGSVPQSADVADFTHGTQSLVLTTDGHAGVCSTRKTGLNLDLSAKQFRVWLKVSDVSQIADLIFYVSSDGFTNSANVRIMPSTPSATVAIIRSGEWAQVTLTWADFTGLGVNVTRTAITGVQLRATDRGGTPLVVKFGAIITENRPTSGCVSFAFDDGFASQYVKARPILDTYGYRATAFLITEIISNPAYPSYLSEAQIAALRDRSRWELGAHAGTANLHNSRFPFLGDQATEKDLILCKDFLQTRGIVGGLDLLAYPGGDYDDAILTLSRRMFTGARTIWGAGSAGNAWTETYPPAEPNRLRSWSVLSTDAAATVTAKIQNAVDEKAWLILTFHEIVTGAPAQSTQYQDTNFQTIVDYVNSSGAKCVPIGEVLRNGF